MSAGFDEPVQQTDVELMHEVTLGNRSAYGELFKRHERSVYRVALLLVRSTPAAEDVVAAAFLELWRRREHVHQVNDSVLPWLFSVASFSAKNQLRASLRYRRLLRRIPQSADSPDHAEEVAQRIDAQGLGQGVRAALEELGPADTALVTMCLVHETPQRDVAEILGIPVGTVKSRLSRLKARLRTRLSDFAPNRDLPVATIR